MKEYFFLIILASCLFVEEKSSTSIPVDAGSHKKCVLCCDSLNVYWNRCISGEGFEGIIITGNKQMENNISLLQIKDLQTKRFWNPSDSSIILFERKFQTEYPKIFAKISHDNSQKQIFDLNNYSRQYLGFVDVDGNKSLLVGFTRFDSPELNNHFNDIKEYYSKYFNFPKDYGSNFFLAKYSEYHGKIMSVEYDAVEYKEW